MNKPGWKLQGAIWFAALFTAVILIFLRDSPAAQIPAFLILWLWPALSWMLFFSGPGTERFLHAAGLSILLNCLAVLLIGYLPGDLSPWLVLASGLLVVAVPLGISWSKGRYAALDFGGRKQDLAYLLIIVVIAIFLRLTNLGYKEFQGDEGVIMVRAASFLNGDESEIFLHQKGPAEILLPAGTWSLTGTIDDYWPRLVFTWAGLLEVVAVYWLGRRWFSKEAGLIAGFLFALGGFGIAFSRIVQYQSLVMLWGTLALVAATRYREEGRMTDLTLTAAFLAGGLLAHYDALLVIPAVLWLVLGRLRHKRPIAVRPILAAAVIAFLIAGTFYIPFAINPNASRTLDYLLADRLTVSNNTSLFGWSGPEVWQMMTFYNSIWYVLALGFLAFAGLLACLKYRNAFAAALYFLVPTIFYLFVVGDPRTHVYTLIPGAVILGGYAGTLIWQSLNTPRYRFLKVFTTLLVIVWSVLNLLYPYLMFVDISVERQRTWDVNRPFPRLFPVTWEEPPEYGLFGFPHQAGWRAALEMLPDDGYPYASNEEEEITDWYMAQRPRTHCADAETILYASRTQDEVQLPEDWQGTYVKKGEISVLGRPSLQVFGLSTMDALGSRDASEFQRWLKSREVVPSDYGGTYPLGLTLGDSVRLLGYDLDTSRAFPGGDVIVTLYWQALKPISRNKQVFVHLYDSEMRAQHDGAPECAVNPTTRWEPGQIIADQHIVMLPTYIESGSIPLNVGMYDLITLDRMIVQETGQDFVYLTDIDIR